MLFPNGLNQLPRVSTRDWQGYVLTVLALSINGQPGLAASLLSRCIEIYQQDGNQKNLSIDLSNLSEKLYFLGMLREAEVAARRALLIAQNEFFDIIEVESSCYLGLAMHQSMSLPKVEIEPAEEQNPQSNDH